MIVVPCVQSEPLVVERVIIAGMCLERYTKVTIFVIWIHFLDCDLNKYTIIFVIVQLQFKWLFQKYISGFSSSLSV